MDSWWPVLWVTPNHRIHFLLSSTWRLCAPAAQWVFADSLKDPKRTGNVWLRTGWKRRRTSPVTNLCLLNSRGDAKMSTNLSQALTHYATWIVCTYCSGHKTYGPIPYFMETSESSTVCLCQHGNVLFQEKSYNKTVVPQGRPLLLTSGNSCKRVYPHHPVHSSSLTLPMSGKSRTASLPVETLFSVVHWT